MKTCILVILGVKNSEFLIFGYFICICSCSLKATALNLFLQKVWFLTIYLKNIIRLKDIHNNPLKLQKLKVIKVLRFSYCHCSFLMWKYFRISLKSKKMPLVFRVVFIRCHDRLGKELMVDKKLPRILILEKSVKSLSLVYFISSPKLFWSCFLWATIWQKKA